MSRYETSIEPVTHSHSRPNLQKKRLTAGQREVLNRQAVEIFTAATNGGLSFQESLAAILLSGIEWGVNS